jgi:hypothetical protein
LHYALVDTAILHQEFPFAGPKQLCPHPAFMKYPMGRPVLFEVEGRKPGFWGRLSAPCGKEQRAYVER